MTRTEVYKALDSERAYQDQRWGGMAHDEAHNLSDWIIYVEKHLQKAKDIVYGGDPNTISDEFRKIGAMCVAVGEIYSFNSRSL